MNVTNVPMNAPLNVPWTQKTTVVLVGPQLAVNVGAVARAMGNFGLHDLRLVTPRDGWPKDQARAVASGAEAIIDHAKVFHSLGAAIADVPWTLAMTRRSRRHPIDSLDIEDLPAFLRALRLDSSRKDLSENRCPSAHNDTIVALIAGCEMAGLSNEQIAICQATICIDTNEQSPSMNLSHAVAVACHYVRRAQTLGAQPNVSNVSAVATDTTDTDVVAEAKGHARETRTIRDAEDARDARDADHKPSTDGTRSISLKRAFFVPVPATSEQVHRAVTDIERAIHSTHAYTMIPKRSLWRQRLHRTLRLCLSDQRHLGIVRHVLATIAGSPRHYDADKRLWPLVAFYFEISASSPLADMIEDVHTHWDLPPALVVACLWLGIETRTSTWTSFVDIFFEHALTIDAWRRLHADRSLLSHVDVGILSLITHTLHQTLSSTSRTPNPTDTPTSMDSPDSPDVEHVENVENVENVRHRHNTRDYPRSSSVESPHHNNDHEKSIENIPQTSITPSQLERCTVAMRLLQEARAHWRHKTVAPNQSLTSPRAWLLSQSAVAWRDQILGMIQSRGH